MLMKSNAVNRDKVNWLKIEKDVYSQTATKENAYQLGPVFRMLFKSLNDFHERFTVGIVLINGSGLYRHIKTR